MTRSVWRRVGRALSVVGTLASVHPAVAQPGTDVAIGKRFSLWSDVLEEERSYLVYLPESYDDKQYAPAGYPVLYLLDGDVHFHAATGVVQFMSAGANANIQIPELIVVAIPNTDRTRDLTPTWAVDRPNGGQDPTLHASGGGDAFLGFLRQELIPAVERSYRTIPYRVIVGHSFGGLLALYAFTDHPDLFQGYVAIDPSVFWDDEMLVRRMARLEMGEDRRSTAVYLSLSDHPPGGRMDGPARAFVSALQTHASDRMRVTLERLEDESHGSVLLPSLYRGLGFVFEAYRVTARQLFDQPGGLGQHFARASAQLGVDVTPPERILDLVGHSFLEAGLVHRAVELFGVNVSSHPMSFNAHQSLAQALARLGRTTTALEHYETALTLNPDDPRARRAIAILRRQ